MHVSTPARARRPSLLRVAVLLAASLLTTVLAGCSSSGTDRAAAGGLYRFDQATPAGEVIAASKRSTAPAFSGELLDGSSFDSTELAGSVTLINFWGSWCAPCRVETPDLQAVYAELRDQGVRFMGVDVKDERQLAVAFYKQIGVEYPSLFDPRGEVALAFRGFPANAVPSTILIDRKGRVAAVYTGAVARDDVRAALTRLLREGGA
jgi:thiol-disulfide isomerase/thioredoxin